MKVVHPAVAACLCSAVLVVSSCRTDNRKIGAKVSPPQSESKVAQSGSTLRVDTQETARPASTLPRPGLTDSASKELDDDYRQMVELSVNEIVNIAFDGTDIELPREGSTISRKAWRRMLAFSLILLAYNETPVRVAVFRHQIGEDAANKAVAKMVVSTADWWYSLPAGRALLHEPRARNVFKDDPRNEKRFQYLCATVLIRLELVGRRRFWQASRMPYSELVQKGWAR